VRSVLALFALLVSTLVVLVVAPGAAADDTPCIGAVTGTHDNVVVPPGQTCTLSAATVLGNVKALQDSSLLVTGSNVRGDVQGDKADIVQVFNSRVREDITIKEGGPAGVLPPGFFFCIPATGPTSPCEAVVLSSTIEEGNVQIEKTQGDTVVRASGLLSLNPIRGNVLIYENSVAANEFISIDDNTVEQNMQVFKNKGPGAKFVVSNTVRENLQCFENETPFTGGGNVARQVQGQCTAAPLPMSFAFSAPAAIRIG
jgi:hypothetical protein